ncbi:hypothetical protein [Synechocystis sp. LKSZ1]
MELNWQQACLVQRKKLVLIFPSGPDGRKVLAKSKDVAVPTSGGT